jgi:hypothetical protein
VGALASGWFREENFETRHFTRRPQAIKYETKKKVLLPDAPSRGYNACLACADQGNLERPGPWPEDKKHRPPSGQQSVLETGGVTDDALS